MRTILPAIISASALRAIPTEDTHAVRIILLNSTGSTQYTLRGVGRRKGKYILEKDGTSGRHVLDIPVSIWNQDIPQGRYQDNTSIAHDLLAKPQPLIPFVTMIVPWNGARSKAADASAPDFFTPLRDLLVKLVPPPVVQHALNLAATGDIEALKAFVDSVSDDHAVALPRFPGDGIEDAPQETSTAEDDATAPEGSGLENIPDSASPKTETAAAKRMREKRARDKAKREADLQPA